MASRNFTHPWVLGRDYVTIEGSFAPNGSSAVANSSNEGVGFTVARTSAGLFTVTLSTNLKFAALVGWQFGLQLAAGDDKVLQLGAVSLSNKTFQIRVWDISGGAETDIAANAANRISFSLTFRNTKQGPLRG